MPDTASRVATEASVRSDTDAHAPPRASAMLGAVDGIPDAVTNVEEQIIVLLRRSRQLWRDAAAAVHPDLQPIGYRLLTTLVKIGPANPGRLADLIETDKSVVSRQARVLESLGLVRVEADPSDGRGRLLVANDSACAIVRETRLRALAGLAATLRALGDDEVEHLALLLERVNGSLGTHAPDAAPAL